MSPQFEHVVPSARGDKGSRGRPVHREDLVGVSRQVPFQFLLLHVPQLEGAVLAPAAHTHTERERESQANTFCLLVSW